MLYFLNLSRALNLQHFQVSLRSLSGLSQISSRALSGLSSRSFWHVLLLGVSQVSLSSFS